jgi:hypothetical protein
MHRAIVAKKHNFQIGHHKLFDAPPYTFFEHEPIETQLAGQGIIDHLSDEVLGAEPVGSGTVAADQAVVGTGSNGCRLVVQFG